MRYCIPDGYKVKFIKWVLYYKIEVINSVFTELSLLSKDSTSNVLIDVTVTTSTRRVNASSTLLNLPSPSLVWRPSSSMTKLLKVLWWPALIRSPGCLSRWSSRVWITPHPFKLGSPNMDHRCKRPWFKSLLFPGGGGGGGVDLDLQGQI